MVCSSLSISLTLSVSLSLFQSLSLSLSPFIALFLFYLSSSFPCLGCTDGDVKLTGGASANEGTVLVCKNSVWGLVAQLSWDNNDANVLCKQLQYTNGETYK